MSNIHLEEPTSDLPPISQPETVLASTGITIKAVSNGRGGVNHRRIENDAVHSDSDDDAENGDNSASQEDAVLLNVFRIDGRPHRCLYHGQQLVWEPAAAASSVDSGAKPNVVPLSDVLSVRRHKPTPGEGGAGAALLPSVVIHYAARRQPSSNVWRVRQVQLQVIPGKIQNPKQRFQHTP